MTPAVSVVMSTVRFDSHLEQAVRSVLDDDGSLAGGVEVVLVADGVRDQPPDWISTDPRITWVELPGRVGTPRALNRGLEAARGELVARLDADDLCRRGRLRAQRDFLADHQDVAVVGSTAVLVDTDGRQLGRFGRAIASPDMGEVLSRRNPFVHSSVMYRRSAVLEAGGYNVDCVRMQDYELFLRLALHGHGLEILGDALVSYRVHPQQSSRNSPPRGPGFRTILRRRRELGVLVGRGRVSIMSSQASWVAAQQLRHLGLRKPGHLRQGLEGRPS